MKVHVRANSVKMNGIGVDLSNYEQEVAKFEDIQYIEVDDARVIVKEGEQELFNAPVSILIEDTREVTIGGLWVGDLKRILGDKYKQFTNLLWESGFMGADVESLHVDIALE